MSRKRKPLLQLGAGSSKLHKYGYSKEFHTKDGKVRSTVPALVGNYSDSDSDDDSVHDKTEEVQQNIADTEQGTSGAQAKENDVDDAPTPERLDSSLDMDDKLKNFLSEIEAIPIPPEVQENQKNSPPHSPEESTDAHVWNGDGPVDPKPSNAQDMKHDSDEEKEDNLKPATTTHKKKPMYSMFVKGEPEFVHSPPPAQDAKVADPADKAAEPVLPEEPTCAWQLVQDDASQYYYYWNTLTNEVTWEIPSEYTQYLLLHKEFSDKLARLPQHLQDAYNAKKAKEAEALSAVTATTSTESATTTGVETTTAADTRSYSRKHKDKKKRRHKERRADGDDDSDLSRPAEFGPQLPPTGAAIGSSSTTTTTTTTSSSQLLSIVPYLSDDDDDDEDNDDKNTSGNENIKNNKDSSPSPTHDKNGAENLPVNDDKTVSDSKYSLSDPVTSHPSPKPTVEGSVSDLVSASQDSSDIAQEQAPSSPAVESPDRPTQQKSKKPAKEVIDMFAEDLPTLCDEVKEREDSPQAHIPPEKGGSDEERDSQEEWELKDAKLTTSEAALPDSVGDGGDNLEAKKPETSSLSLQDSVKASMVEPSLNGNASKDLGNENEKPAKSTTNLLNIGAYGSDDEEEAQEEKEKLDHNQRKRALEKEESSPHKKRKKEKKKHKRDSDRDKDTEVVLPNLVNRSLGIGKDVIDKVNEELDREISDIVIQTVSQGGKLGGFGLDKPSKPVTVKQETLAQQTVKDSEAEDTQTSKRRKDQMGDKDKDKVPMADVKIKTGNVANSSIKIESESGKVNEKVDDDDDDGDIDFEDLDDIDRALEVALKKKKIELAKYEEGEAKQQKETTVSPPSVPQSSVDTQASHKAGPTVEEEEQLKTEIRDIAELALSKLEFLDISTDGLSRLQVLFIELQTRLCDWEAGGLSSHYFQKQLSVAQGLLQQYELSAVPAGWACQWDRANNRYYYRNLKTDRVQWDYPEEETSHNPQAGEVTIAAAQQEVEAKEGGEIGADHRETTTAAKKKSSRHRKRESRNKEKGSRHDKRRDRSGSSHRHRRKRRRRREPSSSSSSSSDSSDEEDRTTTSSRSNNNRKRGRRHKVSKKKKKRRSEARSRSGSVEVVRESDKYSDKVDDDSPDVRVMNAESPPTINVDDDDKTSQPPPPPPTPPPPTVPNIDGESIDGEPLANTDATSADVDGMPLAKDDTDDDKTKEEEKEDDADSKGDTGKKAEVVKPAVIYKPPQLLTTVAKQAEVLAPPLPNSSTQDTQAQGQGSQVTTEVTEETDKQVKKKKKEKKSGPSLMMKKKQMSSMVQKWQKVKKEVEKEDRAKEIRQAAIRKKIEELK